MQRLNLLIRVTYRNNPRVCRKSNDKKESPVKAAAAETKKVSAVFAKETIPEDSSDEEDLPLKMTKAVYSKKAAKETKTGRRGRAAKASKATLKTKAVQKPQKR